jgi:hypothetical protein
MSGQKTVANDAQAPPVTVGTRLRLWLIAVLTAVPPALLAGWLASASARPLASTADSIGLPRFAASMFWSAALVPLALMFVGVPLAYWFASAAGRGAYDAVPAGSTRTHLRLAAAVERATPFGHTRPETHVIGEAWVGAVAIWQPRQPQILALSAGAARLTDGQLDALVESSIQAAHADARVARVRQALTVPLAGAYTAVREIRWGSRRGCALMLVLLAPALAALPPTVSPKGLFLAIPLLMAAAGIGLLVVFAAGGLWARTLVRVGERALGPAGGPAGAMLNTIGPSVDLANALSRNVPGPPAMLRPMVRQPRDTRPPPLKTKRVVWGPAS